jgi:hypothetical protein
VIQHIVLMKLKVDPLIDERIEVDVPSEGTHMPGIATWYWGTVGASAERPPRRG